MGIIIRQSLKSAVVSYTGVAIGAFNVLWVFPRFLAQEEIGIISLLEGIALTLASIGSIGTFNITDRFFPIFKDHEQKHHGYLLFLILYALLGFSVISTFAWLSQDFWLGFYQQNSPEAKEYYGYIVPLAFCMLYLTVLEGYARVHLRIVVPNLLREIVLKLIITLSIVLYAGQWFGFEEVILIRVLAYGIVAGFGLIYIRWLGVLFLRLDIRFLKKDLLGKILNYGMFIMVGGAGVLIVNKIDIMMIPAFLGFKENGVYTIAFFIGTVIEVPRKALSQITTPILSQAWDDQDFDKIREIYRKSSINQLLIGSLIFLGIWCNIDEIFQIMPNGAAYNQGRYVVLFIGLTRLLDMAAGVNNEILLQSKYYRFNLLMMVGLAGFIILTNLYFIPAYGINGAAAATFLSFILFNAIRFFFIWVKFQAQPFSLQTLKALLIGGITFGLVQLLIDTGNPFLNILINSAFITIFYVSGVLLWKISQDVNQLFHLIIARLRRFF